MRFRKKPVVIEAVQWTGSMQVLIDAFGTGFATYGHGVDGALSIPTLEGEMCCRLGDWIIRGVKGELYPCKPDIFAATYEAVE